MSILALLIWILIFAVVLGIIEYVLRSLPPPPPWGVVIRVGVAIILLLFLVALLTGGIHSPVIRIN